ncbi:MAG: M16 family metallopeptidase, partial [Beijerinckiaceae bacterium]
MTALKQDIEVSRASRVQKVKSPAGIEVWLVEDYTVPLVAFDFAFTAGSAHDPEGKAGVANILSGILDEGAGDLDADAFHRALDEKAVEISFHTGHDSFSGDLKTLTRHIDDAFELLRLAVNEPRFDADALERIRSQVIAGIKRDAKDPDSMVARAWRKASFGAHPYGRPVHGDLQSVPAVTKDDVATLYRRLFTRDRLKIAAVGAIDAKRIGELVDKTFANLPARGDLPAVGPVTAAAGLREVIDLDVPQTTLRFSLPGIGRDDPDFIPGIVLNHILGGGVFSARLFKEVREKRGLAYSIYSSLYSYDCTALFMGATSTKNERAAESVQVIEEEIGKMLAEGPTA